MRDWPDVMPDISFEQIWEPYRHELTRNYVSLSELARHVQRLEPELDEEGLRATVLAVIEQALRRGETEAGTQPRGEVGLEHVWRDPPTEIIDRIRTEWSLLDGPPHPGHIVWLRAPRPQD